mmetsp:Transcript_11691/g.12074  ORF Transcript_11691/g.12074 Transcript_11691/m.12074 type:complete len:99 (-) Transcript_11691:161-457(-)
MFFLRQNSSKFRIINRKMGWLNMNSRFEELAGIRESTYRTYVLTPKEIFLHTIFLVLPLIFIYQGVQSELKERYTRIGQGERNFGCGLTEMKVPSKEN